MKFDECGFSIVLLTLIRLQIWLIEVTNCSICFGSTQLMGISTRAMTTGNIEEPSGAVFKWFLMRLKVRNNYLSTDCLDYLE